MCAVCNKKSHSHQHKLHLEYRIDSLPFYFYKISIGTFMYTISDKEGNI